MLGLLADPDQLRRAVQPVVEETLELPFLGGERLREPCQLTTGGSHVVGCLDSGFRRAAFGLGEHILDHCADHVADQRALALVGREPRMPLRDPGPQPGDQRQLNQLANVEEPGAQSVVDVVIVVSDIVGDRRDLRLEPGPARKLEVPLLFGFGHRPSRVTNWPVMLGQPFKRFPA